MRIHLLLTLALVTAKRYVGQPRRLVAQGSLTAAGSGEGVCRR
jgi:hypothetical protein